MPTTHTVAQGETLTRIAKQYKLGSWETIYNHPDNADFRALRGNPNVICPGDKIAIPDPEQTPRKIQTKNRIVFKLPSVKEYLRLRLQDSSGKARTNTKLSITIGGQVHELQADANGEIKFELPEGDAVEAELTVMADNGEDVEHNLTLKLGHLDPVDTLSGVQARCNSLGYDCGEVDGIKGKKTESGIKAFQAAQGLDVDGIAGPKTQAKLIELYGC